MITISQLLDSNYALCRNNSGERGSSFVSGGHETALHYFKLTIISKPAVEIEKNDNAGFLQVYGDCYISGTSQPQYQC